MANLTNVAKNYKLDYKKIFSYLSSHPSPDYSTNFMGNEFIINDSAVERVVAAYKESLIPKKEDPLKEEKDRELAIKKSKIPVTTCDIKEDYEIISPIYIRITNRDGQYSELEKKHNALLESKNSSGQLSEDKEDLFTLLFMSGSEHVFEKAFFIAVEELKERAFRIGADAIVGMKYDMDLDINGFFYLQMYGTAIKRKDTPDYV